MASILVPAEAHAPTSLGAAGQFNLFPYNTSYNRNAASLRQSGVALQNTSLTDAPASQFIGRGGLDAVFGDRFLSSPGGTHFGRASSHGLGNGLLTENRGSAGTISTRQLRQKSGAGGALPAGSTMSFSRRAGSGSVGVASDDSQIGLFYASASQVAAATALETGRSVSNTFTSSSVGEVNPAANGLSGSTAGDNAAGGSHGGATFTALGSGASSHAVSPFDGTTRTVSLGSLNGSVVTTGSAGNRPSAGSGAALTETNTNAGSTNGSGGASGSGNDSLFPASAPIGAAAPFPVPEPGITVTIMSLLGVVGFGLLRGRSRRA